MKNLKRIKLNLVIALVAEFFNKASPFLTILIAKHRLGADSFGAAQGALSGMEVILMFVALGYGTIAAIHIGERRNSDQFVSDTAIDVLFLKLLNLALAMGILFVTVNQKSSPEASVVMWCSSLLLIASALETDFLHLGRQTLAVRNILLVVSKIVALIGVYSFVHSPADTGIYTFLSSSPPLLIAMFSLAYNLPLLRKGNPSLTRMWMLFKKALPFGVAGLFYILFDRFDVLLLQRFYSLSDVGIYSSQMRLVQAASSISTALVTIYFSELLGEKDHENFKKIVNKSIKISMSVLIPVLMVAVLFGQDILRLLFGADVAAQSQGYVLLSIGACLMSIIGILGYQVMLIKKGIHSFIIYSFFSLIIGLGSFFALSGLGPNLTASLSNVIAKICLTTLLVRWYLKYLKSKSSTQV